MIRNDRSSPEHWCRSPRRRRLPASPLGLLHALLALVLLGFAAPALATDDSENSAPTSWWVAAGQSVSEISSTLSQRNARLVDIAAENTAFSSFTVTYVQNTGAYAKAWWWYYGVTASALGQSLQTNDARLISLKAYDIGGGNIRFAAVMIANTGADAKGWWWYYGETPAELASLAQAHNARMTALQSYSSNGQTVYAAIMISNTGADAKPWWWWYNVSPAAIASDLASTGGRLLDLTPVGNGNFNATLEGCSSGCPASWWYFGLSLAQVETEAQNNGGRAFVLEPSTCGSSACYDTLLISNTPADVRACDPAGCISEAALQADICNSLAGRVVGYTCLVGQMRPMAGGLARTSTDAPALAMAPSLPIDVASVGKTMTAIGILQLLARDGLPVTTKISPYIYPDWTQNSSIGDITFYNLLTHTSGLGQLSTCESYNTYQQVETLVATGVNPANIGTQAYGNCNFSLLRELMPALLHDPLTNYANGAQRAEISAELYIGYMRGAVFEPSGVTDASCAPPGGTGEALSYPYPAGSTHGIDWGDLSLQCGAGGWKLSANDLFDVLNTLANTTTLLTDAERHQMFSECLGWDCGCPSDDVCKNGAIFNGAGIAVWAYAGIFKCNVPVVVQVNSPLPAEYNNPGNIFGLVNTAIANATESGSGPPCP